MSRELSGILDGIEAVIFDMDGTLIDSNWIWEAVDIDFYREFGLIEPEGFKETMEGMSFREVAELFLRTFPSLTLTSEELQKYWTDAAFQKYTEEVQLKEGIVEFLDEMKRRGMKLGIATSNGQELVEATLESLDIRHYFSSVRTGSENVNGKPAPDIYLLVSEELQIDPSKCLVFEDVPMGIKAGLNAGMTVCAIHDRASEHQLQEKKELAHYYIVDYNDINQLDI